MNEHSDALPTATWETLQHRAVIVRQIREFFDSHDYTEVETPLLSRGTVIDAHIDLFELQDANGSRLFLQSSPELGMKRLLAGGATAIYQLAKAFRQSEVSERHNPEFTLLEWYKVGHTYHDQMTFTESLVQAILLETRTDTFARTSYDDAFRAATGTTVLDKPAEQLVVLAKKLDVGLPESIDTDDRDEILNVLLAERVEPTLGRTRPEFLYDYPATQSALAKVRDGVIPVAERFELYIDGIEICNGYQELTDPAELRRRIEIENARRVRGGRKPLPGENFLLEAMEIGLPECSGVALGLDRIVMLGTGRKSLASVISFPYSRV